MCMNVCTGIVKKCGYKKQKINSSAKHDREPAKLDANLLGPDQSDRKICARRRAVAGGGHGTDTMRSAVLHYVLHVI